MGGGSGVDAIYTGTIGCERDRGFKMEKKKILIVDDDEAVVRILSINLAMEGFEVYTAFDGMSAVMSAHKILPDLIILDVRMPAGDGFSVVERLRTSTKTFTIPILFLSALPKEDIEEKALQAGVSQCFAKPFDPMALIGCINGLLGIRKEQVVANM
ncbi:MAG: DNA-binding response regulator [Actinobacteria bacterium]|nr:MAG: DNA-binding response regulator [Actinomycetota bacterium]